MWIYNPCAADHGLTYFSQARPFWRRNFQRLILGRRITLSVQDFARKDPGECTAHEGTALTYTDELFSGNCVHKFEKVAVEIRIARLVKQLRGRSIIRH